MKRPDIEGIEKRIEAATKGPWRWNGGGKVLVGYGQINPPKIATGMAPCNARLLAHARTDIPALLDYIKAQDEALREAARLLRREQPTHVKRIAVGPQCHWGWEDHHSDRPFEDGCDDDCGACEVDAWLARHGQDEKEKGNDA